MGIAPARRLRQGINPRRCELLFRPRIGWSLRGIQERCWMATFHHPRVAVLHQAVDPPIVNGVTKPKKPGGYRDSGSDIAYVLRKSNIEVITPSRSPDPNSDEGWTFPDTTAGILDAIRNGANTLWANTILFQNHPLQTARELDTHATSVKVVGQPPNLVEMYDDKNFVNELLRSHGGFTMPACWIADAAKTDQLDLASLPYPVVAKPIRGRGSHGVKLCPGPSDLRQHLEALWKENPVVMIEEFLSGEEGTVTVMPPSAERDEYWAMPMVVRFNHDQGIAPYNGVVAVTANSRVPGAEQQREQRYVQIARECERIAKLLKVTAPIRVDVRQRTGDQKAEYVAFDVNMKPNMTGPGRPGRENQASLTAMAAVALGWDYATLLGKILQCARSLSEMRTTSI